MSEWTEEDSSAYREIADVAVPHRTELMATLLAAVPFDPSTAFRVVELGSGEGLFAESLLSRFPQSTVLALDGSESMRQAATRRTILMADRVKVRPFQLASLDWWDLLSGSDLVVSALCLHHLPDAKKQYLYKAVAERLSGRGALLIADLVDPATPALRRLAAEEWDRSARDQAQALGEPDRFARFVDAKWNHFRFPDPTDRPSALFHHLVWLKHAGFADVDCLWMSAGHAVFGGFK